MSNPNINYNLTLFKRALSVFCVLLFMSIWLGSYYNQKRERDAIDNGKRIKVKISSISYGRLSNLYFDYKGAVHGVKYYDINLYHIGDSITVIYSGKYDFFLLNRPAASVKPIWFNIISLLIVVVVLGLVYRMDKKLF